MINNTENQSKEYAFGRSPEEVFDKFVENMQAGKKYCADSAEHWAGIKTFHLPKELIVFNLGVCAFLGAMYQNYQLYWLCASFILGGASIILSFWFTWVVANENINNVNKRQKVFENAMGGLLARKSMGEVADKFNPEMAAVLDEMRKKERWFSQVQRISIVTFVAGLCFAILGLVLPVFLGSVIR